MLVTALTFQAPTPQPWAPLLMNIEDVSVTREVSQPERSCSDR